MNIYIRPIDMNDLPQFWAVRREAQQHYGRQIRQKDHSCSFWNERVAQDIQTEGVIFFAEQNQQLVGTIALAQIKQNALIWGLYIRESQNKELLATSLLATARNWSANKQLKTLTLPLLMSNHSAYQFYQASGFTLATQEPQLFWANGQLHQESWFYCPVNAPQTPNHLN